jgi:hypothetical protein
VFEEAGLVVSDGVNPPVNLNQLRLFLWVKLGDEYSHRQAVLDTGAPFTILPKQVWAILHRRGSITWVAHTPGTAPRGSLPIVVVGGSRYPFRLGRVAVQVTKLDGSELRPVPVLAQCLEDEQLTPSDPVPLRARPILGLAGGLLHGRQLLVEADAAGQHWSAALVEP